MHPNENPPAEPAQAELATDLRLVLMRAVRRLRSQRVDDSLTLSQLSALATVDRNGPLSAGEVAAAERVQPPSMTKILYSLESGGLIERTGSPVDRRQSIISVSPAGKVLLDREIQARDGWLSARLAELTEPELELLRQAIVVLDRIGSD